MIETLIDPPGPIDAFWVQIPLYVVTATLAIYAFILYGAWLLRIREHWDVLPLGWMVFGLCLDRLAIAVNEISFGLTKAAVGLELVAPAWLSRVAWVPKGLFVISGALIVFAYYHARAQARNNGR